MPNPAPTVTIATRAFRKAVKAVAAGCERPTLATLTTVGDSITGRAETQPPAAPLNPDTIEPTLASVARLLARYAHMCDDVAGYALILPGQRVAIAADRIGRHYVIQLPGDPTEPVSPPLWETADAGLTAMIAAITR